MEANTKQLLITLLVLLTFLSIVVVMSYKKLVRPNKTGTTTRLSKYDSNGKLMATTTNKDFTNNPVLGFFIIFFVVIIIGAMIYTTILRYKIAYASISSGNTAIGMAALSPEIGSGIGSIFRG